MTLSFDQALQIVDQLVRSIRGKPMNQAEKVVFQSAWDDTTYQEVAENSGYKLGYLQSEVAHELFTLLKRALGRTDVTKKSFAKKGRIRAVLEQRASKFANPLVNGMNPATSPAKSILGGRPPDVSQFVGYANELADLQQALNENQCLILNGTGGVGKSFLAAKLMTELSAKGSDYEYLIWKSVRHGPHFREFADELLKLLLNQLHQEVQLPNQTTAKISMLIDLLRSHRCLLVLDGAEALLNGRKLLGQNPYGDHPEYGQFIARVVEEQHQSCLLLTTQEPFWDIIRYRNFQRPVSLHKLQGIGEEASRQIFSDYELTGEAYWGCLIKKYGDHPLRLKLVSSFIKDFFAGDVGRFIDEATFMVFKDTIVQQLNRLSELEKELLIFLANQLESGIDAVAFPQILTEFRSNSSVTVSVSDIVQFLKLLSERSLVESTIANDLERYYSLQPMVKKIVLNQLAQCSQQFPKAI